MNWSQIGRKFLALVLCIALLLESLPLTQAWESEWINKDKTSITSEKEADEKPVKKSLKLETVELTDLSEKLEIAESKSGKNWTEKEKSDRTDALRETLKKQGKYRVIIKSPNSEEQVAKDFGDYDATVKDLGNGLYEVLVPMTSDIAQDILVSIDEDKIPETLFDEYSVIEPEIVESLDTLSLSGERLTEMWGMEHIWADLFQSGLVSLPSIKVWVMDTGIDSTHDDLAGRVSALSYDFIADATWSTDDNGHGTHVAGVIAGEINGGGIFGVNPGTELVSLKVLDENGYGTTYDILEAISYAREQDIAVLNMSFGWGSSPSTHPVCTALADAQTDGMIIVAAAGNSNTTNTSLVPANCEWVINVWAIAEEGTRAGFSNYGTNVDLFAPWANILTTGLSDTHTVKNGTSIAAGFVSGLLSKELAEWQTLRGDSLISHLRTTYNLIAITGSGGSGSGTTGTGLSSTGGIVNYDEPTPIDYSEYKYYSGTFTLSGTIYGNSLYPDSLSLTGFDTNLVEVMSYEDYLEALSEEETTGSGGFYALVPTGGLAWEWKLYGTGSSWTDTSWNGRTLTPTSVTWTGAIKGDVAGSVNLAGWSLTRTDDLGLGGSEQNYTLSLWARPNGGISSQTTFITMVDADYHNYSYIEWYGWQARFIRVRGWIAADIAAAYYGFNGGETYHIAGTYDGNTIKLYINGTGVAMATSTGNGNASYVDGFYLWSYQAGWSNATVANYNGHMQSVRAYDSALSDAQIEELYNEFSRIAPAPSSTSVSTPKKANTLLTTNTGLLFDTFSDYPFGKKFSKEEIIDNPSKTVEVANTDNQWDPVSLSRWEFTYDNTLMSIPWVWSPYEMKVYYKNQTYYNGPVWVNWDHNFNMYLTGDTLGNIVLYDGKLNFYRFFASGSTFRYNDGIRANLISTGGLYEVHYDDGRKETFNSLNRLKSVADSAGNTLSMSYSGDYLTWVVDTLGRNISYEYYDHNRLSKVTDFNGQYAEFIYLTGNTASGSAYDLERINLSHGSGAVKTIRFEYTTGTDEDSAYNMTKLIDANGQTYVANTYDGNDRVATQQYGTGTITYAYTTSGSVITKNTVTNKLWYVTEYSYDATGNQTSVKYYNSGSISSVIYDYEYNTGGLVIKETHPRWNGYTYDYDARGNLTEKRFKVDTSAADDSSDLVTTYTYDSQNRVLTETSPIGATVVYTRDAAGNILTKTLTDITSATWATSTGTTTYTYNDDGLLETITTPEWNFTRFAYSSGQVSTIVRWTWSLTSTGTMTYDDYGNMLSMIDGEWNTKTMSYTPWNLLSTGTTTEGIVSSFAYDANNNKTRETKYLSWTPVHTYFYYDTLDRLVKTEQVIASWWAALVTTYTYDENDNVIAKKVWSGATVTYKYDEFSKPIEERVLLVPGNSSLDLVTAYVYDSGSNLVSITDPGNNTTTHNYSLYDRITASILPDETELHYSYNADNTIDTVTTETSTGYILAKSSSLYDGYGQTTRVSQYTNPNASTGTLDTTTIYDRDLRPIAVIDPKGNMTTSLYNGRGNVIETTDAIGNTVSTTYDKRDLPLTKTVTPIGWAAANTTTYVYDDDGRIISEEDELTNETTYIYNSLNQVTRITDALGHNKDFTYDYLSRKLSETEVASGTTITTGYGYDERWNLTSVTDGEGNITIYSYDAANRNTDVTYEDATSITMTYDKNSNLATRTDAMGTLITNTYDDMNRLTARSIGTGTWVSGVTSESYTYDPLGRLIAGSDSQSGALSFAYDPLSRLSSESQFIIWQHDEDTFL
jgi:YD repeat-containing protein